MDLRGASITELTQEKSMNAVLFVTLVTILIGIPYYKISKHFTLSNEVALDEPTNAEIRQSPQYRQWRDQVVKRDEYRCIWCKSKYNLEAHHLYSFAGFPELRFDIKNGITLCHSCHLQTPNYGSKEKAFSQRLINS